MDVGERVEVHTRLSDSWAVGFEIASIEGDGYRLRRTSDGMLLPDPTSEADVRPMAPPPPWELDS
jgi:hypothetical protein